MAKAYSRGLQMALGGGGQSPLRFAVMELRRMMDEMRAGHNLPSLARMEWRRVIKKGEVEGIVDTVVGQAERAHEQAEAWAAELNIVVRALVASTTLDGGFWDGVPPPMEEGEFGDPQVMCTAYDGHEWRYVRESRDGMMRLWKCQLCGEEVMM